LREGGSPECLRISSYFDNALQLIAVETSRSRKTKPRKDSMSMTARWVCFCSASAWAPSLDVSDRRPERQIRQPTDHPCGWLWTCGLVAVACRRRLAGLLGANALRLRRGPRLPRRTEPGAPSTQRQNPPPRKKAASPSRVSGRSAFNKTETPSENALGAISRAARSVLANGPTFDQRRKVITVAPRKPPTLKSA
jgi:hypothetical protein